MAEDRSDHEPSIEESLASSREIIADDDAAEEKAAAAIPDDLAPPAPEPEPEPVQEMEDDILDLSAFASESTVSMKSIEERADPLAGIDLSKMDMNLAFTDPVVAQPAPEPEPAPTPQPEPEPEPIMASKTPPPAADIVDTDSLLTQTAAAASVDALSRLAQNIAISRAGNGGTLEDIVREMIRPMLKDWLDRNLPPMIERMVERELERMVKAAMDR